MTNRSSSQCIRQTNSENEGLGHVSLDVAMIDLVSIPELQSGPVQERSCSCHYHYLAYTSILLSSLRPKQRREHSRILNNGSCALPVHEAA